MRCSTVTEFRRVSSAAYPWCAECVALGCNLDLNEPCSCECHEAANAARAMGLSLVREETDSGGDPRARLYP